MDVNELVRIHDKNQFEIKLGYLIDHTKKKTEYDINIYFFIPKSIGINKYTYSNNQFFEDFYSYVRLITPKNSLTEIIDRLENLSEFIKKNKLKIDKHFEHINYELKIIICSYRVYLRKFSNAVKNGMCSYHEYVELVNEIKQFRKDINRLLDYIHYSSSKKIEDLFLFADEYSSLLVDVYIFRIIRLLSSECSEDIKNILLGLVESEVEYRKQRGYSVVSKNEEKNEELVYKYSVYKKFFYSILFLYQKRREDYTEVRHFAYAIAAGIAMIFATAVAFFSQKKYGSYTLPFFVALVVSYMFKDRMKDFFRQLFDDRFVFRKVYDYRNKIYDLEKNRLFGYYKERVRFIDDKNLPELILNKRLYKTDGRMSTWFLGENILKYERKIKLFNKRITDFFADKIEGLNDIIRFNISSFTKKLDDPYETLYKTVNGKIEKVSASKVYHVNLVIEFKSDNDHRLHKVRLVLTKEGIKRIELPEFDKFIKKGENN
ncbi:conserved hypothetical protein [Deferribacter desulfuricans SSM1]|uniref:Uncharacterized protein n=1 Tax=Deferribacter desulfuricans (strain DSM 14783 / JCM 11476 / NBRC 101012 / SSM1) TaxID=639282 RepID=D3P8S2_DEFDS|nr:hypothetical protein [Deferribacter desulfuricans]BAI81112.1 conserved hypothetical protein [Deferribacter desulfuricans SSM1]